MFHFDWLGCYKQEDLFALHVFLCYNLLLWYLCTQPYQRMVHTTYPLTSKVNVVTPFLYTLDKIKCIFSLRSLQNYSTTFISKMLQIYPLCIVKLWFRNTILRRWIHFFKVDLFIIVLTNKSYMFIQGKYEKRIQKHALNCIKFSPITEIDI